MPQTVSTLLQTVSTLLQTVSTLLQTVSTLLQTVTLPQSKLGKHPWGDNFPAPEI